MLMLSLMVTIIFIFLRTLSIILILDERYMCCSMKILNKSQYKHIFHTLASDQEFNE